MDFFSRDERVSSTEFIMLIIFSSWFLRCCVHRNKIAFSVLLKSSVNVNRMDVILKSLLTPLNFLLTVFFLGMLHIT